ncbi:MAG: ABC transporter ATP-binding protein [Phycisphaerales bacterium]|nr:ABC transporter ATP-binding protein [Phycisphaerales bacterium]
MPTDPGSSGSAANIAISVRNVGKRYDIYDRSIDKVRHLFALGRKSFGRPFWALRGATFDVPRGQAVGVVGRNGSGKSTLMQIIAGTLSPTEGEVHIRGRVAALLELGSGFNPQFTGRENVFLAGSILGVSRREMESRFDEIASFADIGAFIDQPVEVYSSGMHARLAFSVAVCVQPDILIVDEILSVGDAGFQQRCISRMRRMLDDGMTLLLVSHSAETVKSICSHAVLLNRGNQEHSGPAGETVDRYMHMLRAESTERAQELVASRRPELADAAKPIREAEIENDGLRYGTGHAGISAVRLLDEHGRPADAFVCGEKITIEVVLSAQVEVTSLDLVFVIRDRAGINLFGSTLFDEGSRLVRIDASEQVVARITFTNPLAVGPHGVALSLVRRPERAGDGVITLDHLDTAAAFEVIKGKRVVRGKLHIPFQTSVERVPARTPAV